ncbi:unnamed protein product [Effrenium voratum]|nr:unnamed protein product [Effrenium voratum]
MSSLRALCPQTCGCDDPLDPAAAAYATTVFGCPKFCIVERSMSTELKVKPCEDLPPEDFAGNIFMKRFLSSMFDYITSKQELRRTEILQYTQELRRTFWNQVPGPNKTESLLLASVYFSEGKWMEDVANGVWNLGLNIPHPRGMRGCDFLNSWEFEMITGSNFCRVRGDSSPFKSLRSQCPVACNCRKGQDDCPGTCPVGF